MAEPTNGIVDFKDAEVLGRDPANQSIVGRVSPKVVKLGMFTTARNAVWAADRAVKMEAYPLASVSFVADRRTFRLEVGDAFVLNYAPYGISGMVFRVVRIEEASPTSESITISALEDIWYISSPATFSYYDEKGTYRTVSLDPLLHTSVWEAPFIVAGEDVRLVAVASRETLTETGFQVRMSLDGTSYGHLDNASSYAPYGTLVENYLADAGEGSQIDDGEDGVLIDFSNADVSEIESVSRADLFTLKNLAMLGDEIISFQTITPVSGSRYRLTGIYRGRLDTEMEDHSAGEDFFFLGTTNARLLSDPEFLPGSTRYLKYVPFNTLVVGDESEAQVNAIAITGRALTPYKPVNFAANGESFNPLYTDDVLLTWSPRIRGQGTGVGDPDTVAPDSASWEGYFEVEVWVAGSLKRTQPAIDDDEWTYTEAMNLTDNGSLASTILFKLKNYREAGGVTYSSGQAEVIARLET